MLTDQQVWILGIVALVLIQVIKIVKAKFSGVVFSRKAVQYISMLVALVVAGVTIALEIGPIDLADPVQLVSTLAIEVAKVFGLATAMYMILFKKVAESLSLDDADFLTSKG